MTEKRKNYARIVAFIVVIAFLATSVVGVTAFVKNLRESRAGKKLNPKYEQIQKQYEANSDGILEFLKERNAL